MHDTGSDFCEGEGAALTVKRAAEAFGEKLAEEE